MPRRDSRERGSRRNCRNSAILRGHAACEKGAHDADAEPRDRTGPLYLRDARPRRRPRNAAAPGSWRQRARARGGDQRDVPAHGRDEGLGPAPERRRRAARPQGRRDAPAARRGRPVDVGHDQAAAPRHHAAGQPRGIRGAARHRLRLRDRRPGALPRERLPRPPRHGRGVPRHPVEDPDRRAARALAAHPGSLPADEGARARHRADRLRQVDDALRDDRLHQPQRAPTTSSRSRTRSSSCTRTRSA